MRFIPFKSEPFSVRTKVILTVVLALILILLSVRASAYNVTVHLPVMDFNVTTGITISGSLSSFQSNDTDLYNMTDDISGGTLFDNVLFPSTDVPVMEWAKSSVCPTHWYCLTEGNATHDGNTTIIVGDDTLDDDTFEMDNVPPSFGVASEARLWIVMRSNVSMTQASVRIDVTSVGHGSCDSETIALISQAFVLVELLPFDECGAGNPLNKTIIDPIRVALRQQGNDDYTITAMGLSIWWTEPDYGLDVSGTVAAEIGGTTYLEWACVGTENLWMGLWNGSAYQNYTAYCTSVYSDRTRSIVPGDIFGGLVRFRLNDSDLDGPDDFNISHMYYVRIYETSASESWGGFIWLVVIGTGFAMLIAIAVLARRRRFR